MLSHGCFGVVIDLHSWFLHFATGNAMRKRSILCICNGSLWRLQNHFFALAMQITTIAKETIFGNRTLCTKGSSAIWLDRNNIALTGREIQPRPRYIPMVYVLVSRLTFLFLDCSRCSHFASSPYSWTDAKTSYFQYTGNPFSLLNAQTGQKCKSKMMNVAWILMECPWWITTKLRISTRTRFRKSNLRTHNIVMHYESHLWKWHLQLRIDSSCLKLFDIASWYLIFQYSIFTL